MLVCVDWFGLRFFVSLLFIGVLLLVFELCWLLLLIRLIVLVALILCVFIMCGLCGCLLNAWCVCVCFDDWWLH